ncbi:MAG: hypothetical protein H0X64_06870, partial [Gemmatimonadaceae bacterium]|nr:hypothetical protein [Gemmatimonadaceae bacterium]
MSRMWVTPRLLAAVGILFAIPASAAGQGAQVISRAELDAGGWTRLSELFFAVRGVTRTSVDG